MECVPGLSVVTYCRPRHKQTLIKAVKCGDDIILGKNLFVLCRYSFPSEAISPDKQKALMVIGVSRGFTGRSC